MMATKALAKGHPLVLFFMLAFAFSWVAWAPAVVLSRGPSEAQTLVALLHLVGSLGPMVSALIVTAAQMLAWFPPYRVLMVWVYDRTESLLLAMLMHGSATASLVILASLTAAVPLFVFTLVFGAALWVGVGAVAVAQGGHLSRRPPLRRRVA